MNRLFLAIPVLLYDYDRIKKDFDPLLQGRWREESQLHVTVAFMGGRFEANALTDKLSTFHWLFEPSELRGFDYFCNSRVFVSVSKNPTLQELYNRLAPLLGLEHTDIRPHTTLMRVKKIIDPDIFRNRIQKYSAVTIGILEPKIVLYKSVLHSDGAHYTPLKEWLL